MRQLFRNFLNQRHVSNATLRVSPITVRSICYSGSDWGESPPAPQTLATPPAVELLKSYRDRIKQNPKDIGAILGLARCIEKGAPWQLEDMEGTCLEGRKWLTPQEKDLLVFELEARAMILQRSLPWPNRLKK